MKIQKTNRFQKLTIYLTALLIGLSCMIASSFAQAAEQENLWKKVQEAGVLRAGTALAPPYVIRDPQTGKYSGIYVDLVREFAEKYIGVKVKFIDTTWDNIIAGLQAGKWDISLALNRTPKRALAVTFSKAPMSYDITLLYNKNNKKINPAWTSLKDFDKKDITLTTMSGTAADHALTGRVKNASIMRLPDVDSPRMALISRRADVLVDAGDTNLLFAKKYKDWAEVVNPSPALAKQGIAFAFRHDVPWKDIEVFNIFLEEQMARGDVVRLVDQYLDKMLKASN